MTSPFSALSGEYISLLARMQITRQSESHLVARRLLKTIHKFDDVTAATGVPQLWGAASFEREASSNFGLSPAQGDPWSRRSVHVPAGRGPFASWGAAAIDAYKLDHLDQVGAANWTWARACYEGELFNGFGYRSHGIHSPYLWSGTSNYTTGKYTSDGHFDSSARDQQLGIIPVMAMMVSIDPSFALVDSLLISPIPVPNPAPVGVGGTNTAWLQHSLNILGADPKLSEDGSYGRMTSAAVRVFQAKQGLTVDGLAGPETMKAIAGALPATATATTPATT